VDLVKKIFEKKIVQNIVGRTFQSEAKSQ